MNKPWTTPTKPLNPVLSVSAEQLKSQRAEATPLSKLPPAEKKTDRTITRLSNPENFALVQWLKDYKAQPGDTLHTITRQASTALNNPKINFNHVQQRMSEFDIPLPKRPSSSGVDAERLNRLEHLVKLLASDLMRIAAAGGVGLHPDLIEFANAR